MYLKVRIQLLLTLSLVQCVHYHIIPPAESFLLTSINSHITIKSALLYPSQLHIYAFY